jgi:predicted transcriptional regulator
VETALGGLERQVMERLWASPECMSVRELRAAFGGSLAYTTLLTTVDRLFKKGLLDRRRQGRAFAYSPRVSRDQLREGVASDVIDGLLGDGTEGARPLMSAFVQAVEERDAALLDELEALVRERRRLQGRPAR